MSTGLNFQTCTIINSNVDINSSKLNGKDKDNKWLFRGANEADKVGEEDVFRVKRDFVFKKSCIQAVTKAVAYDPVMCKAVVDFNKIFDDIKPEDGKKRAYGRIDIYLGLEGSEEFLYANPWIQKGMPLWVEFTVESKDTAETLAKKIKEDIKKDKNFLIDHELIVVTEDGGKLTFEGADEYQRLRKVEVVSLSATEDYTDLVAKMAVKGKDEDYEDAAIKLEEHGENGFGTYSHIIRDLRLPTVENTYYSHLRQVETPVLGAKYNQFIIDYCDDSTNDGTQAVGSRLKSHTQHVFWVNQDCSDEFELELAKVFTDEALVTDENREHKNEALKG